MYTYITQGSYVGPEKKIYTKDLIKVLTALNVAAMLRWGACGGCTRLSRAKNGGCAV